MLQTERLYKLKHWFDSGRCVGRDFLLRELGVSSATLKRDLAHLRDRMNAPVIFDRERQGWRFDRDQPRVGLRYELPGLWFSSQEIHALLTMQQLLAQLDAGGLLGPHIEPLAARLGKLLESGAPSTDDLARRIKVHAIAGRPMHLPHFQAVGSALLRRQRLAIEYQARGRGETSNREVSPQRLIHYRDNWFLDAWCHLRNGLRSFSVDAVQRVDVLATEAIEVPDAELDEVLGSGYGIFAGKAVQWATLRFSAERARWVATESWHPKQRGRFEADGCYLLELPYADPRELVMDILRHVLEVEVVEPQGLREAVAQKLRVGLRKFRPRVTP
jgi:predicted DNA-binding transcriptional regulator YafY